jgi:hypothetical protein
MRIRPHKSYETAFPENYYSWWIFRLTGCLYRDHWTKKIKYRKPLWCFIKNDKKINKEMFGG